MLSTPNSRGVRHPVCPAGTWIANPRKLLPTLALLGTACVLVFGFDLTAQTNLPAPPASTLHNSEAVRINALFIEAKKRFEADPTNAAVAWQFGRVAFDWGEFATNNAQRASIAEQGIAACKFALQKDAKSAPAQYYLGLNLGQLARTKRFSALHLLDEMEAAFLAAIALDETLD